MSADDGRIITFYSYKGGTGRSMALANIAWLLAAWGKRVLAIDWDLEAPGLHRYFHPFLRDPESSSTPGVIDFVTDFANAATQPRDEPDDADWHAAYADITRYAVSLDTTLFPGDGTLDFVSSGRQGAAYAARVNSFDWQSFWDRLGGAALMEEMRTQLRAQYDYVLIDSRTGVSDTSGICTIALPDDLVVAFTLNRQSVYGAAAVTQSIVSKRDRTRFRVFPVPMRVEFAEKDRLELARSEAQREFEPFLWHISPPERKRYWGDVEVLYYPYYAYEEVLAVFADRPDQRTSLLAAMEQVMARLTHDELRTAIQPAETDRRVILEKYRRQPMAAAPSETLPQERYVYLSVTDEAREFAIRLTDALEHGTPPIHVLSPERDLRPGDDFATRITDAVRRADCVLTTVTGEQSSWQFQERETAAQAGRPIVPLVLQPGALSASLELSSVTAIDFSGSFDQALDRLRDSLQYLRSTEGEHATLVRRLDEARASLGRATTDSARQEQQVLVDDLMAQLARLGDQEHDVADRELLLRVDGNGTVEAEWQGSRVSSPIGIDPLARRALDVLTALLRDGRLRERREVEVLGDLLYAMLFPGAVSSLLSQALAAASSQLPLRLVIAPGANPDSLADLPWELLHRPSDATSAGVFIATIGTVVISRAIRADDTFPAPEIADGPLRVVLAASHAAERADSAAASMQRLAHVGALELTLLHDRPLRDLLDALDHARPAVLHVIAPARRGPDGTEIALEWTADTVDWISAHRIGDLLAGLAKPPALVVLELLGGEADAALPSEAAATLATFAVAATLELPSNVTARAASTFFERLYERLGSGRAIDASVADARRALLRDSSSASFALPTLYMNHPGPIAVPAGRPEPAPAPAPAPAPEPAPEPPPAAPPDDAVDPAVRRRLRRGLETADPWRTVERLAIEAAVPEEVALRVLRDSDDVRFSQGRSGRLIAGLVSRVGPAAARQR